MKNFLSFVNIDFLAGKDSLKNWRMLLFVSVLLMLTIYSSHSADQKIFLITKLNKEVNTFNSVSVSTKLDLMNVKMESKVTSRLKDVGLSISKYQPIKLIIKD
ncbi:MAG: S-adenosyl-methyltransferase [Flavobacteriales bacterium]|nr:S-adenosyl-methyltransferase [Flavobacteriales bacterium]MBL6876960.1 S-adenosyl-methyltransferase [Flavobacteriales bacterium]